LKAGKPLPALVVVLVPLMAAKNEKKEMPRFYIKGRKMDMGGVFRCGERLIVQHINRKKTAVFSSVNLA
jgi:hypothetical protein